MIDEHVFDPQFIGRRNVTIFSWMKNLFLVPRNYHETLFEQLSREFIPQFGV